MPVMLLQRWQIRMGWPSCVSAITYRMGSQILASSVPVALIVVVLVVVVVVMV